MQRRPSPLDPVLQGAAVQGLLPLAVLLTVPLAYAPLVVGVAGGLGALVASRGLPFVRARRGVVVGVATTAVGMLLATLLAWAWWGLTPWGVPPTFLATMQYQPVALGTAVAMGALLGIVRSRLMDSAPRASR